jgi:hypothetical protein
MQPRASTAPKPPTTHAVADVDRRAGSRVLEFDDLSASQRAGPSRCSPAGWRAATLWRRRAFHLAGQRFLRSRLVRIGLGRLEELAHLVA